MYKYILSLDPSGAFEEGQGTTGWCLMSGISKAFLDTGVIPASSYPTPLDYWAAHTDLIGKIAKQYPIVLLVEDYLLYAHKADSQINSRFETCQLIGILKYYAYMHNIPIYLQRAAEVKTRWSNTILVRKEVLRVHGRSFILNDISRPVCKHELDAIRHAMHFNTFYNK